MNKRAGIATDHRDFKIVRRKYYEKLYANNFNNLDENGKKSLKYTNYINSFEEK